MNSGLFSVKTGVLFSFPFRSIGIQVLTYTLASAGRAEQARASSAFSDFGSEGRVLLSNSLVVIQDPLQVRYRFTTVFCIDLLL